MTEELSSGGQCACACAFGRVCVGVCVCGGEGGRVRVWACVWA